MTPIYLMALRHSAFYTPYLMTIAGGFLRDEGLAPHYSVATPARPIAAAFASHACHVAQSAVATSFAALERGERPDVAHFAQINNRDGFFLVARAPARDFAWRQLAGATVLVDHLFQPLAMLRYALYQRGVPYDAIDVVDAGGPEEMERAFRHGVGAYVHLQGPAAQHLERDGVGCVVAAVGDVIGDVAFSSLCAPRAWLTTDMARAFMRAYRRASRYVCETPPAELAARLHHAGFFTDIHPDVVVATVRTYRDLQCWRPDPVIPRHAYDRLVDVCLFGGVLTAPAPYDAVVAAPPE